MVNIRRAELADIASMTELRLALFRDFGEIGAHDDVAGFAESLRQYFAEAMPRGEFVAWVAEADGNIVGTGGLAFFHRPPYWGNFPGTEAYVLNMYTMPAWRGRGIATGLINAIIAFLKTTGVKRVWLSASAAGRPIYEKAGFTAVEGEMELSL